jgi:replicative DNA helicase
VSTIADPQFEQGLPCSPDAERTILGAVLLDNHAHAEAAEVLRAEDFYLTAHQRVFARMGELIDSGHVVDIVTLSEELAKRKEIESIGGVAWLASLTEGLPRRLSISEYVSIVKEKSMMRAVIRTSMHLTTRAADQSEDVATILADADNYFRIIADRSLRTGLRRPFDIISADYTSVDQFLASKRQIGSVVSGWSGLDRKTNGWKKQELIIFAARPSMGKTAAAINMAIDAALRQEKAVAVFSLETSAEALIRRAMCGAARVDSHRFQRQALDGDERQRLTNALSRIVDAPLYLDDTPAASVSEVRAKCRRQQKLHGLDLVIVDYLQLMSGGRRYENRTQEVSAISRSLKAMAKELDVPVIALSQLSRENEKRQDKRPVLSDLRESGSIEQDADVVCFLHRPEYYDRHNPDLKGQAEFILAKQREGPTGTIPMVYMEQYTRFECAAREGEYD